MKKIKKVLALALAFTVILAMSAVSAFAETQTYTVTITQNSADKGTHTYAAYQIFSGDLSEKDGKTVLSNIAWGSGVTEAVKKELGDAKEYAKGITGTHAAEKAAELSQYLAEDPAGSGTNEITGLAPGYYLIQDNSDSPSGSDPKAKTKFILKVLDKDVTAVVKTSVPSVDKAVGDNNKAEAHNVGDVIPYTITAIIGDGIDNFDHYSFQFVDTMSAGLTLDQNSWDIKVGEKSIKSLFTLTSADGVNNAKVWTWKATDIKDKVSDGSHVVLTYNAKLNSNAVLGSAGNPNTVVLKFDNDPNSCGNGEPGGSTPESKAIVFTYKTVFNKVDGDAANKPALNGADFTLEKKVNGEWVDVTNLNEGENAINPTKSGSTEGSKFTFSGLGNGEYRLTETTTPTNYNTMEPIVFTINSTFDETKVPAELKTLTGTDGNNFTMTPVLDEGSLTATIENHQGSELPETGGMGTTIFYIIGGILVIGAGILLIARRRMQAR